MPRPDAWTVDEVADLRTIAADTTLTWAEVATAIAARDPSRPKRTTLALRMAALRYGIPHRTDDTGRQLRPSTPKRPPSAWAADKAPAPDLHHALDEALSRARAEGRAEVLDALRALLDIYDHSKETK
jgi:hypothetical protein